MICKPLFPAEYTNGDMKKGYTLLLAVVITATVLSAATALAGIVISEIRQTRDIVSGIKAYAKAEAGTEQALFMLRKSDLALEDIHIDDVTIDEPNDPQYFSVAKGDFVSIPVSVDSEADIEVEVVPSWEVAEGCAAGSWIELSTTSWGAGGFSTYRHPYSIADIPISIFLNSKTVELRIRALYCDISKLTVSNIPGRVKVVSTAEEDNKKQAIETNLSRKAPVAGLFDFVIFSEEEIVK